jgi:hypothetical protein
MWSPRRLCSYEGAEMMNFRRVLEKSNCTDVFRCIQLVYTNSFEVFHHTDVEIITQIGSHYWESASFVLGQQPFRQHLLKNFSKWKFPF